VVDITVAHTTVVPLAVVALEVVAQTKRRKMRRMRQRRRGTMMQRSLSVQVRARKELQK
jgi:hypothetical protein